MGYCQSRIIIKNEIRRTQEKKVKEHEHEKKRMRETNQRLDGSDS